MSRRGRSDRSSWRGLVYRDRENGLVMGVCAGLADAFDWPLITVRTIAVLCLLLFTTLTVLVYLVAGLVLPDKPLTYYGDREKRFWRTRGRCASGRSRYST